MLLENKIALITGAGRGIGKATAKVLAEEGALTVLLGRNIEPLRQVKSEIEGKGGKADCIVCDLRDESQITAAITYVLKKYDRIDILINNAAITVGSTFLETPLETFDEHFLVDFRAPMLLTRLILPGMINNSDGVIVNVSAAEGERGGPGASAYASAKAALINLTKSVGEEVKGLKVRINSVCPGPVDTELFHASATHEYEIRRGGDLMPPETVANAILYLASDMSRGMNCQIIKVRGANRW